MSIQDRKKDHVELTSDDSTQYEHSAGFDKYQFIHNALPEVNFDDISTEALFLDQVFRFPLFISSMTGGYAGATAVNQIIAEFCQEYNLPFGVGSQRAMLEHEEEIASFKAARDSAPNAFIAANIGGVQLINGFDKDKISRLTDSIQANAVIVHLNPLQELMQPEGDRNFKGIKKGIELLVTDCSVPVIVKETGAGISKSVASYLIDIGVQVIDVSGSGGTSWAKVENQRSNNINPQISFDNWGLPTLKCLEDVGDLKWEQSFELISSGGIRNAFDIAKSICLGANMTAMAQPIIKAIMNGGVEELEQLFSTIERDFKTILCLIGCDHISQMNSSQLYTV